METIGSMNSSSSPSSITIFDSFRHSSIEEMLSELNFLVDESEIRPLTPPRSPVEHLAESSDAQCCENDFVKVRYYTRRSLLFLHLICFC
uniref:Ovule protein n=1 Tax=Ascaris lumbricoides TaxID=6252 RepID=A0A0M3HIP5_ASCLU